jgi:hypothetical protein
VRLAAANAQPAEVPIGDRCAIMDVRMLYIAFDTVDMVLTVWKPALLATQILCRRSAVTAEQLYVACTSGSHCGKRRNIWQRSRGDSRQVYSILFGS